MPAWLSFLFPYILQLLVKYGVPDLEKKFPWLKPIVDEILAVLGGLPPSASLTAAANHYNSLGTVAQAPDLKN